MADGSIFCGLGLHVSVSLGLCRLKPVVKLKLLNAQVPSLKTVFYDNSECGPALSFVFLTSMPLRALRRARR